MFDFKSLLQKRKRRFSSKCSLYIGMLGISMALTKEDAQQLPITIDEHVYFPFSDEPSVAAVSSLLDTISKNYDLKHSECTYVLSNDLYRLLLINIPPRIKDEDLRTSAPLLVSELIDFPETNLATDVFLIPSSTHERKAYISIVKKDDLMMRQQQLISADINLSSMTLSSLALTYLAGQQGADLNLIVLTLSPDYSNMLILQNKALCLAHALQTQQLFDNQFSNDAVQPVITDIKRTIQFYLADSGSALPIKIVVMPMQAHEADMIKLLSEGLEYPVEKLNMTTLFKFSNEVSPTDVANLIYPLGGLLTPGESS